MSSVVPSAVINANASISNPVESKSDNCSGGATIGTGSTVIVLDIDPPVPVNVALIDSVPGAVFVIALDSTPPIPANVALTDSVPGYCLGDICRCNAAVRRSSNNRFNIICSPGNSDNKLIACAYSIQNCIMGNAESKVGISSTGRYKIVR